MTLRPEQDKSRSLQPCRPTARVGPVDVGGDRLVIIAGPCVVESRAVMREVTGALVRICGDLRLPLILKSSFEKDNRTRPDAFRGPGLERGLALLAELKAEFGVPITSDIHRPHQAAPAAQVLDLLQIPAFLCRQTSLLEAAGASGVPVNIKKGQFAAPEAMAGSLDKVRAAGGHDLLLTERGSSWSPGRLVVDMAGLADLRGLGCPLVFDAGHAANSRAQIPLLARCGVAAGVDALFVECHPNPPSALCDGGRMLSLTELEPLLKQVATLDRAGRAHSVD